MIRSYDEYATLFEDSFQDAIRFVPDPKSWANARWEVHVGSFETSGANHVADRWVELPLLTETMRALVRRVVANTTELLQRMGRNESTETQDCGTLTSPRGIMLFRARAANPSTAFEVRATAPSAWGGQAGVTPKSYYHRIAWPDRRPEFFVWEQWDHDGGHELRVSGADFTMYARMRDFERYEYFVGTRGDVLNYTYERVARNETGDAWIGAGDAERV